jgi:predicted outer membrane protein
VLTAIVVFASTAALRAPSPKLNDMEIAHVLVTSSDIAITHANLAIELSDDARVLAYAEGLIADSKANRKSLMAFVKMSDVALSDSSWSDSLTAMSVSAIEMAPQQEDGEQFVEWFSESQAAFQSHVATLIETELLPNIESVQLKKVADKAHTEAVTYAKKASELVAKVTG